MQKVRRLLVALLCLLVGAVVLLFTLENRQSIELEFLGHLSPSMPLAVAILLAFVLGAFFSLLIIGWSAARQKSKNRGLQRKLERLTEKLEQAKEQPVNDSHALVVSPEATRS